MPAALVTSPAPRPASTTETVRASTVVSNRAVTERAPSVSTWHRPVPEQSPLQPANVAPGRAAAVSRTDSSATYWTSQVSGHWMPSGVLVTEPGPSMRTVSV